MKIKILYIISIIFFSSFYTSCSKDNLESYKEEAGVHFLYTQGHELKYSFLNTPDEKSFIYELPVRIEGDTVNFDRIIQVNVLKDSTTASSEYYEILHSVIEAGKFNGKVKIQLNNLEDLKSKEVRLWLVLGESKDFKNTVIEYSQFSLLWDNRMSEPANWRYYSFGAYSSTIHEFMLQVLGVSYLEYGYPDNPSVPNLSWQEIKSYRAKMRTALRTYNREHPDNPMRHEDGESKGELVVIP